MDDAPLDLRIAALGIKLLAYAGETPLPTRYANRTWLLELTASLAVLAFPAAECSFAYSPPLWRSCLQ